MLATVGPSSPRGPAVGLDSADSGSEGTGGALDFEEPSGAFVEPDFVDSAPATSSSTDFFFTSESAAGVADFRDFFFVGEADGASELGEEAFGVAFADGVGFETAVGVGFGVELRVWVPPDFFFFGSTPEAIRTILRKVTISVRALRVME
jgi:hypothetical protein